VAGAAIYAGLNPYTMDDAAIAHEKDLMARQRPLLRMYTSDMTPLVGALAGILTLCHKSKTPGQSGRALAAQIGGVAGTGFEPVTFRL